MTSLPCRLLCRVLPNEEFGTKMHIVEKNMHFTVAFHEPLSRIVVNKKVCIKKMKKKTN